MHLIAYLVVSVFINPAFGRYREKIRLLYVNRNVQNILTTERIERPTFRSGVERATIAPSGHIPWCSVGCQSMFNGMNLSSILHRLGQRSSHPRFSAATFQASHSCT